MPTIYIKDYDTEVEIPEGVDMAQVQAALQKQFPAKKAEATPTQRLPEGFVDEEINGANVSQQLINEFNPESPTVGKSLLANRTFRGIFDPVIEGLGLAGGSVLGLGAAGPMGGVAGAGLGYAGAKNLRESLDAYAGLKPDKTLKQQIHELPGEIATGEAFEAVPPVAGRALSFAGRGVKQLFGATTGAGPGTMEEALKGGKAFTEAMRGKVSGEEIVENVRGALQSLKEQRGAAYREKLAQVTSNQTEINLNPIKDKFNKLLSNYGVKENPIPAQMNGAPRYNFDRSVFGKSASNDVAQIAEDINSWGAQAGDNTAIGLDTLKRRLDDFYSDSSQARQFVASLRDEVKNTITKQVPEYASMTKGYADATNLIKDVEKTLMVGKKDSYDQTLRRVTSSMRENFEMRKELVDILGAKTGQDLAGQVAGYNASHIAPRGLVGKLSLGGGAGLIAYINPSYWPLLSAASPRAVGEFLKVYGKGLAESKKVSPALYRILGLGITEEMQ